jgi:ketosteroid isomerase-like protein
VAQENVDLIRRIYDVWDRDESARELISEDVEYVNPTYAVEPGTRRGRAHREALDAAGLQGTA